MATYQNQTVTVVRAAGKNDPGFDAAKDQVVIKLGDGTERTVLKADVKN